MKHYFLGMAANYAGGKWLKHLVTVGREKDCQDLKNFLSQRYSGQTVLCKNGRSALALALKAYFKPGDRIIVNGFTCYAVYEAVKAAGLVPIFADISQTDLNFSLSTLRALDIDSRVRGIIVQNTLGNPVDIKSIEKFAHEHHLMIVEDLAHCAGIKYPDGREAGTVGVATALSFGKDKSIDTISGGAVVLRDQNMKPIVAPNNRPTMADHLRARFYPMLGATCRNLSYLHLGGALMRLLVECHLVEKSADNRLDLTQKISKFEAKLALAQLKTLRKSGEPPLRSFYLVHDRTKLLEKLKKQGFYFAGFWYEKPVSPARYYQKVHFPEAECPNSTFVADHIINLPTIYTKKDLEPALKIIKEYEEGRS